MRQNVQNYDIGIVVISCDKYEDLWPVFFDTFFSNCRELPYPVYLVSNGQIFDHPDVTTVTPGNNIEDWSETLLACLPKIKHERLWFFFEDGFIVDSPDPRLWQYLEWAIGNDADYFRFSAHVKPSRRVDPGIGLMEKGSLYRTVLFGALVKKAVIQELLRAGETAWQFEMKAGDRSASYEKFYGLYEHVFNEIHGVERGVWYRTAVNELKARGYEVDTNSRAVMSHWDQCRWRLYKLRGDFFRLLPSRIQPRLLKLRQHLRATLGG